MKRFRFRPVSLLPLALALVAWGQFSADGGDSVVVAQAATAGHTAVDWNLVGVVVTVTLALAGVVGWLDGRLDDLDKKVIGLKKDTEVAAAQRLDIHRQFETAIADRQRAILRLERAIAHINAVLVQRGFIHPRSHTPAGDPWPTDDPPTLPFPIPPTDPPGRG